MIHLDCFYIIYDYILLDEVYKLRLLSDDIYTFNNKYLTNFWRNKYLDYYPDSDDSDDSADSDDRDTKNEYTDDTDDADDSDNTDYTDDSDTKDEYTDSDDLYESIRIEAPKTPHAIEADSDESNEATKESTKVTDSVARYWRSLCINKFRIPRVLKKKNEKTTFGAHW
jgi:hypothetical protein